MNSDDFRNRLRKRAKHLARWAARWPTEAYRIYDWDIPDWAFGVDRYGDAAVLQHFVRRGETDEEADIRRTVAVDVVAEVLGIEVDAIFVKERRRQQDGTQYEKLQDEAPRVVVEDGLRFQVDLAAYLDTGLFLDHREMRRLVAADVERRQSPTVANLFAYTGAFSVWAARAGAVVTTVDLSNTYLEWAEQNFRLNGFDPGKHVFERSDVMRWLPQEHQRGGRYDVIVLDPPTFSRSKKMVRDLDTQRDHLELVRGARALLNRGGVLYFSNNFRGFTLDESLRDDPGVEEITGRTIPEDFKSGIHRAWRIRT